MAALARAGRTMPLVLVGPVSRWAQELAGVQLTGAVPDDELAAIYSGAHALVFPSDEEGFGLPPVEALACGTPVAACDVPALREVLADRITLTDVDDLDGLVRHAEGALTPGAAAAPVELGRRRARPPGRSTSGPCCARRRAAAPSEPRLRPAGAARTAPRAPAGAPERAGAGATPRGAAPRPRGTREQVALAQQDMTERHQLVARHPRQVAQQRAGVSFLRIIR